MSLKIKQNSKKIILLGCTVIIVYGSSFLIDAVRYGNFILGCK